MVVSGSRGGFKATRDGSQWFYSNEVDNGSWPKGVVREYNRRSRGRLRVRLKRMVRVESRLHYGFVLEKIVRDVVGPSIRTTGLAYQVKDRYGGTVMLGKR